MAIIGVMVFFFSLIGAFEFQSKHKTLIENQYTKERQRIRTKLNLF
jgi:hypothetical protein